MSTAAPRFFPHVYGAFAAGYLLSYFFRNVNAVISPELTRELALSPSALGLLTAVYFVAFAAMQVPAGMLLDRYGPRRVEPALLLIASAGALAFAIAGNEGQLLAARALIGLGAAVCLMAPLKAIATWYPPERQASLGGWVMVAGSVGALGATAPLEFALRLASWRTIFVALSIATFAAAALIWWRVPDIPSTVRGAGLGAQWSGVRTVFANPRFWWIAPLAGFGAGSFMAIQGLWSVPWMMEVDGHSRALAAQHLLAMGVAMLAGYLALGLFTPLLARRGAHPRHVFGTGFALNMAALAAILAGLPGAWVWWSLYGLGATVNVLAFTVLNEGFAVGLAGRANTALNLAMIGGSFGAQWGIGLLVDASRAWLGIDVAGGLKIAFAAALALYAVSFAWFAWGWRQHAGVAVSVAGRWAK
jgi:predicted MFS family arabinose efflux permease